MRFLLALAVLPLLASPAAAQLVVPLTTPDGRVACTQGMTGIGRPPDWQAIADPDGPDGWTLAETAGDPTDLRFPLCISEQAVTRDVDATLRFKPLSGSRARVAGLLFRAQSANDYYVVRANALDNSVRLYRVDKGKRSQVGGKEAPIESDKWHSLRLIAANDRFEVSLDGKVLFDRHRPQPAPVRRHGRVEPGRQRHPLRLPAGRAGDAMSGRTSCRSSTICAHSPRISSVGGRRSGTMTVIMPAAAAARTPLWESSRARQSSGATPSSPAAFRNGSGAGLCRAHSRRVATTWWKRSTMPCASR